MYFPRKKGNDKDSQENTYDKNEVNISIGGNVNTIIEQTTSNKIEQNANEHKVMMSKPEVTASEQNGNTSANKLSY